MQTVETRRKTLGTIKGKVIKGRQVAGKLGFPTANLQTESVRGEFRTGVYGVIVTLRGSQYEGIMNKGIRPTFENLDSSVHYEVHLFQFDQCVYGETLEVDVCFFVRDEMKFPNVKQLKAQIEKDFRNVSRCFKRMASAEDELHLTDLDFSKLCEDVYGVNRGVYNTIDSLFYAKGFTHIMDRRKTILTFLEYLNYQADVKRTSRIIFGNGGLTTKLQEFYQLHLRGC